MNVRAVLRTVGRTLLLEAALLLLTSLYALLAGEECFSAFLCAAISAGAVGALLTLPGRKERSGMSLRDGFATATLSWVGISLFGALPFTLSGALPCFADALFETVSGFSTTGASVITSVESLDKALLFWRSFTHWLGGMGVLVLVMALTENAPDRSINILRAEMPGHSVDKFAPSASGTARTLLLIYVLMTALECVLLLCGGMPVFDSVIHAIGTAGTGGFGIKSDSVASYNPYIQWVITAFMLLFGVSFSVYCLLLRKDFGSVAKMNELWCYLGIFGAATLIITLNLAGGCGSAGEALRLSAFQTSSVMSTTGFATADFDRWPQLSKAVLVLLMIGGGCMGSTAGGLKISRVRSLVRLAFIELRRSVSPRSVSAVRQNGRTLGTEEELSLMSYLVLYLLVILATFLLISFEPFGFETNFTAALSCVNNIGPGFGLIGPAGSYADYSAFSKLVLSAAMLMGRLEIYPLAALMIPGTRSVRR